MIITLLKKEGKKLSRKEKLIFKDISQDFSKKDFNYTFLKNNRAKNPKILRPHPFLKWAGGKRQLIPKMKQYLPTKFNNYIEPFVGGGAMFFFLFRSKLLNDKRVVVTDINEDLINCYNVVKNNVMELIKSLKKHKNEKNYFYRTREKDRNPAIYNNMTVIEKASRIIYLNRCCYNGLYRVNSKGYFNVPFGKYKNPNFCDEENLISVNRALKTVETLVSSFEKCLGYAKKGDFVYFDPPYFPISETSSFTSYTKESFGKEAQVSLCDVFKELDKIGCKLVLSNSDSVYIRDLYKDYKIVELLAKRAINCDGKKRGEIKELLITNCYSG